MTIPAILVIKTVNGYAVMPVAEGHLPQCDIQQMNVSVRLTGSTYSRRELTVSELLEAHFEPRAEGAE